MKIVELPSGRRRVTLRIANTSLYTQGDGWAERTGSFEVEAWNSIADATVRLKAGQAVHVEGSLEMKTWTDL